MRSSCCSLCSFDSFASVSALRCMGSCSLTKGHMRGVHRVLGCSQVHLLGEALGAPWLQKNEDFGLQTKTQHHRTENSQQCYCFACLVTLTSIFYSWVVTVKNIKNAVQNPHHLNKASGVQCLYLKSKTSTEARAKRKSCIFMTINKDNYILIMKTGFF